MNFKSNRHRLGLLLFCCFSFTSGCAHNEFDKYRMAGVEAYNHARYGDAEKILRKALKEAEKLSSDDPEIAGCLNDLAGACQKQGKYA
jgi:hypothetical protein